MGSGAEVGLTGDSRRLSVIVPALNEARWLPILLGCLASQTRPPDEVIVADADSTDETVEVARQHGAVVVRGGRPGVGRNAGAAVATGDLIMFLDADARPEPDFIAKALDEFADRRLVAATAPIRAVEDDLGYQFAYVLSEAYLRAIRPLCPHAVGLCILVDRTIHERVGGFDESLVLGEDHDYARRVSRLGKFRVLRTVKAKTSSRRIRKEGRGQYIRVLVGSELRTLAGRPIRRLPDGYEFGAYEGDEAHVPKPRRIQGVLRQWSKPSSELQGDAIGVFALSVLGGVLAAGVLKAVGADGPYRWVVATAGTVAAVSGWVAAQKLRYERPYGTFMSTSVAVASDDVVDASGATLVRAGIDEICELHLVRNVRRMAEMHTWGPGGRLAIRLDTLEALRDFRDGIDDPHYRGVTHIVARSDLVAELLTIGFTNIPEPPALDWINRVEKHLLLWQLGMRVGSTRRWDPTSERLVIMSREDFTGPETRAAVDALIARMRGVLDRIGPSPTIPNPPGA